MIEAIIAKIKNSKNSDQDQDDLGRNIMNLDNCYIVLLLYCLNQQYDNITV